MQYLYQFEEPHPIIRWWRSVVKHWSERDAFEETKMWLMAPAFVAFFCSFGILPAYLTLFYWPFGQPWWVWPFWAYFGPWAVIQFAWMTWEDRNF